MTPCPCPTSRNTEVSWGKSSLSRERTCIQLMNLIRVRKWPSCGSARQTSPPRPIQIRGCMLTTKPSIVRRWDGMCRLNRFRKKINCTSAALSKTNLKRRIKLKKNWWISQKAKSAITYKSELSIKYPVIQSHFQKDLKSNRSLLLIKRKVSQP